MRSISYTRIHFPLYIRSVKFIVPPASVFSSSDSLLSFETLTLASWFAKNGFSRASRVFLKLMNSISLQEACLHKFFCGPYHQPIDLTKNWSREFSRSRSCHVPKIFKLRGVSMSGNSLSTSACLSVKNEAHGGKVGEKDAVIIVDHGSRRQESNLMLNEFVAMFKNRTGFQIVEPAHMELASPAIRDAFKQCVQQGANRIIISPFFLFPGRHWHQDIPALAAEAAKEHSGISYLITAPLGLHELMVDVMMDRINYCLSQVAGDAVECCVCAGTSKCRLYQL